VCFMSSRRSLAPLLLLLAEASGWSVGSDVAHMSRRSALGAAAAASCATAAFPLGAFAASKVDVNDLTRLNKGLEGVQYLLDNWKVETRDPVSGELAPDRVRYYVGLRSTEHPLFQVDKLLTKAQDKLPDDVDFEEWINAVEGLNSHIAKVNELAYTSSFGEYNPGGGKEQVAKYLELARLEVVDCRDSLETMVKLLKL